MLWKDLTTESAKNLTFRNTNFSKSLFDGMTLSHIQLNAPHWRERWGRKILYNEEKLIGEKIKSYMAWARNEWELRSERNEPFFIRLENELKQRREKQKSLVALLLNEWKLLMRESPPSLAEWRNIEDQYTQLKNNLERQGAYQQAGYLHQGEQEIRQKILFHEANNFINIFPNFLILFLGFWYKLSSGYGEKPFRAIMFTFVMVFGLTLFNSHTKNFMDADFSTLPLVNYSFCLKTQIQSPSPILWQVMVDILPTNASCASLSKNLIQTLSPFSWREVVKNDDIITDTNWWRYAVFFAVQILLLGLQLPNLIMTVRRRFKR